MFFLPYFRIRYCNTVIRSNFGGDFFSKLVRDITGQNHLQNWNELLPDSEIWEKKCDSPF
jgi:hypothetical protein